MAPDRAGRRFLPLALVCAAISAALLIYSQTAAFAWDEGFHLVAAQLIVAGKRPYLDWLYPQSPLNAYWNALWMRLFGESWRLAHVLAAVETSAAIVLIAAFTLSRFPVARWRLPLAILCAVLTGSNLMVVEFGAIAQAYGFCLLGIVAGFWLATLAVDRPSPALSFASGIFAGIAAGASLLTAPVAPVLLIWILLCNRAGSRIWKLVSFAAGVLFAFLPILRLFASDPGRTWFSLIEYHFYYREVAWSGAVPHDLETLAGLFDSAPALLLFLLALGGLLFVYFRSGWERARKQEFYLCAFLAVALAVHLSTAHPTFARYFLFTTPFLSYLAAAGLYFAGSRLWNPGSPGLPVAVMCVLATFALAKQIYDARDDMTWSDVQKVAAKVGEVTPAGRPMLVDEAIYFLLHRLPPPGNEMHDSHKLNFSPDRAAELHILPEAELENQIRGGRYGTIERCYGDDWFQALHAPEIFRNRADVGDCTVYWDWKSQAAR